MGRCGRRSESAGVRRGRCVRVVGVVVCCGLGGQAASTRACRSRAPVTAPAAVSCGGHTALGVHVTATRRSRSARVAAREAAWAAVRVGAARRRQCWHRWGTASSSPPATRLAASFDSRPGQSVINEQLLAPSRRHAADSLCARLAAAEVHCESCTHRAHPCAPFVRPASFGAAQPGAARADWPGRSAGRTRLPSRLRAAGALTSCRAEARAASMERSPAGGGRGLHTPSNALSLGATRQLNFCSALIFFGSLLMAASHAHACAGNLHLTH